MIIKNNCVENLSLFMAGVGCVLIGKAAETLLAREEDY
jgi:hypothetical protein